MIPKLIDAASGTSRERAVAAETGRGGRGPYPGRLADRVRKEQGYRTYQPAPAVYQPAPAVQQPPVQYRGGGGEREYYNSQGQPYPGQGYEPEYSQNGATPPFTSERAYYQPNQGKQPYIICTRDGSCQELPPGASYQPSSGGGRSGGGRGAPASNSYRYDYLERTEQPLEALTATRIEAEKLEMDDGDDDGGGGLSSKVIGGVAAGASVGAFLIVLSAALCLRHRRRGSKQASSFCNLLVSSTRSAVRFERRGRRDTRHYPGRGRCSISSSSNSSVSNSVVTSASCSPASASADPESASFALPPPAIPSGSLSR